MLGLWLGGVAFGDVGSDVARGWYLWRTGQDEAAAQVARQAADAAPDDLGAQRLYIAMEVLAGNGASVEARYREAWGQASQDPIRRVALAFVVAQRATSAGAWCSEVEVLTGKVAEGEAHYWATVADRQRLIRCGGDPGHADAEMRRIAKAGGVGWVDGVIAQLEAGYIKDDLPPQLERAWTEHPDRLDRAGVLWTDRAGGPGRAKARTLTSRALDEALASSDPVHVHAALLAFREATQDRKVEQAIAALAALDPAADPNLVRSVDDVRDPALYSEIAGCLVGFDPAAGLRCLDALKTPEAGAITAYWHTQRLAVLRVSGNEDEAYAAARSAWQADPAHRFNARVFAREAVSRKQDAALAVQALDVVLAGRVPEGGAAAVAADSRGSLARDLELQTQALRQAGRASDALPALTLAYAIDPTPERQLLVGLVLGEAGETDEAVLQLAYGLAHAVDDTARISEARDALAKLGTGWHPRGLGGLIDDAARAPGDPDAPPHALLGSKPAATWLPEVPADQKPSIAIVGTFAGWVPDSVRAVERLSSLGAKYAEQGVRTVVLDVASSPSTAPEGATVPIRHTGPSAMRALKSVALPTVFVVDAKGVVVAALSPWDRSSLALEKVLDGLLPAP